MVSSISRNKERVYSFFVYLIVFLSSTYAVSDKDFGWHYKYGEYFFKTGHLLWNDIFSWTLPNFPWVNHSWGYDPIFYLIVKFSGYIGVSIVGGLVMLVCFLFLTILFKLSYWKKAILGAFFVILTETTSGYGLRSQSVSLMLFSVLLFILILGKEKIKALFFLPLLFLTWANLHGDFTLGLGILGVFLSSYFLIDFFEKRKFNKKLFIIYLIIGLSSFTLTLINPFGYKVYFESIRHIDNPYLTNVYEWEPIYTGCSYCHAGYFIIYLSLIIYSIFIFLRTRKFVVIPFLILSVILIDPSFQIRRFTPIFAVITIPLLAMFLKDLKFDLSRYKILDFFTITLIFIFIQFNLYNRFTNFHLYNFNERAYCYFASGCSVKVINYIISHPPKGRGFNFYDWGGYMIGRGVPVKLFIDGRMHVWRKDSYQPFGDYIEMYYHEDYKKFNNYNFDWLLLPSDSNIIKKIQSSKELGSWRLVMKDNETVLLTRVR